MTTITATLLDRIKPTKRDKFIRDSKLTGFGVKITPKGRISFFVEARVRGGRTRRKTLGTFPATPIQDAREKAMEFLRLAQSGVDPVKAQRKEVAKAAALSKTVKSVFDDYCDAKSLKPKTLRDYRNTFDLVFNDWHQKQIREITRQDAEGVYKKASKNRGSATAGKASRIMSAVFNYAMADEIDGERLIRENPFDVIKQKKLRPTPKRREHYLDVQDINKLITFFHDEIDWGAKDTKRVTPQGINYVMLLLSTGLRRSEAASLRWEDVNWYSKQFVVRETKNGTDHHVPMSTLTNWILKKQKELTGESEWVFPANSASGHLEEPKSQIAKITVATGVKFTSHDLRRTFATHADASGASKEMIREALNHKSGGSITDSYIIRQVDTLRPVFELVSDSYHTAYDPDWKTNIEAYEAEKEYGQKLEPTAETDGNTDFSKS